MPIIESDYKPSYIFRSGFFSTIYASKFRIETNFFQQRERITLVDSDFIDLDWSYAEKPTNKLVILLHGLEGNAQRTYIKGMGRILKNNGWDTTAMNFRGCSGEDNLLYQSYHSGKTDDLIEVISHILEKDKYQEIAIVGFSLGGNLLLKYLGEQTSLPKQIKKGVAISVPTNLKGSIESLMSPNNWMYNEIFLSNLKKKYKRKMKQHPNKMNASDLAKIKTLKDFDDIYTSKAHGFKDAYDYYEKNSSNQFLANIKIPTLILNAKNDSFLNEDCYPFQVAETSKNIYLETPEYGGHVGFYQSNSQYYSEMRTLEFLN